MIIMTVVTSYLGSEENIYSWFDLIDLTDMPAILKKEVAEKCMPQVLFMR